MAGIFPLWLRITLAVLTALSTHVGMAHAATTPGEIADFSSSLALDTFALKDLVNEIVQEDNGGALQDVFRQYNVIIDTLGAEFQYLPGSPQIQDAGVQQSVFEAYSNFVQGLLELSDAVIAGAGTLVHLDSRNYFNFPSAETNLQSVFDPYAFSIIALYPDDNDIHQQMVVQKARVDASILRANAAIHLTNQGVPPTADPNPPANLTSSATGQPTTTSGTVPSTSTSSGVPTGTAPTISTLPGGPGGIAPPTSTPTNGSGGSSGSGGPSGAPSMDPPPRTNTASRNMARS